VKYLTPVLRRNSSIHTLNISMNAIGTDGAKWVSAILKENETICFLDISWNQIDALKATGALEIASALEENSTLCTLNISMNRIENIGGGFFLRALRRNHSLIHLNIASNALSGAMKDRKEIQSLVEKNRKRKRVWSARMNWVARLLFLQDMMPNEMIEWLAYFLPPDNILSKKQKRRVTDFACNISFFGYDQRIFLRFVFGKHLLQFLT